MPINLISSVAAHLSLLIAGLLLSLSDFLAVRIVIKPQSFLILQSPKLLPILASSYRIVVPPW
jgi:hypothetical protein